MPHNRAQLPPRNTNTEYENPQQPTETGKALLDLIPDVCLSDRNSRDLMAAARQLPLLSNDVAAACGTPGQVQFKHVSMMPEGQCFRAHRPNERVVWLESNRVHYTHNGIRP